MARKARKKLDSNAERVTKLRAQRTVGRTDHPLVQRGDVFLNLTPAAARAKQIMNTIAAGKVPDTVPADRRDDFLRGWMAGIPKGIAARVGAQALIDEAHAKEAKQRGQVITEERKARNYAARDEMLSIKFEAAALEEQKRTGCNERDAERAARKTVKCEMKLNIGDAQLMRIVNRLRREQPRRAWKK